MRLVTAHLFSSVDGVVEAPDTFQYDSFDEGLGAAMGRELAGTDTMVMGRVLYQEWADYWPSVDPADPFAQFINNATKQVASRTLTGPLDWQNTHLIDAELIGFVRELKRGEGGTITVGGISVVRQLFLAGVIDKLILTVHPVVAGNGRKLFQPGDHARLELVESETTEKGNLILGYRLRAVG